MSTSDPNYHDLDVQVSLGLQTIDINCLILGNDTLRLDGIWTITIMQTKTIDEFKNAIKDIMGPKFDNIASLDDIKLWSVFLPIDNKLEDLLKSFNLDNEEYLPGNAQLSDVFPDTLEYMQLHIIIQPMSYYLNCLVLGNSFHNVFFVEIAPMETISTLKKIIKDSEDIQFGSIDADCLRLWDVSLPIIMDWDGFEHIKSFSPNKEPLLPATRLSKVFCTLPKKHHLHIMVQV